MSSDGEPIVSQFTQSVNDVIDKYQDQGLTVSEAIGALELVKAQIIHDAMKDNEAAP